MYRSVLEVICFLLFFVSVWTVRANKPALATTSYGSIHQVIGAVFTRPDMASLHDDHKSEVIAFLLNKYEQKRVEFFVKKKQTELLAKQQLLQQQERMRQNEQQKQKQQQKQQQDTSFLIKFLFKFRF